jgi:hypothetical protein
MHVPKMDLQHQLPHNVTGFNEPEKDTGASCRILDRPGAGFGFNPAAMHLLKALDPGVRREDGKNDFQAD